MHLAPLANKAAEAGDEAEDKEVPDDEADDDNDDDEESEAPRRTARLRLRQIGPELPDLFKSFLFHICYLHVCCCVTFSLFYVFLIF